MIRPVRGGRILSRLLLASVVASCGGRTDSMAPTLRTGDFPAAAARAFCENAGTCCRNDGRAFDSAVCASQVESELSALLSIPPSAADTRIPYRCVDQVAAAARECHDWSLCFEFHEAVADRAVLGEPCSGTCFPFADTNACGGNGGQGTKSCYISDGLFCSSESGNCEARVGPGQRCFPDDFVCVNSSCRSEVCAPSLPEGADCTQSGNCADGLVCEADSRFCLPLTAARQGLKCTCDRLRPDGAACSNDQQCASAPCNDGRCQHPPFSAATLDLICSG